MPSRDERRPKTLTIRLSEEAEAIVAEEASRLGRSRSAIVEELALEAAKMRLFPGIGFRDRPRRAWVIGTGLDVWQVIDILESFKGDVAEILLNYPLLSERRIRLAQAYHERFPKEIQRSLDGNRRPMEELRRLYPFLNFGD